MTGGGRGQGSPRASGNMKPASRLLLFICKVSFAGRGGIWGVFFFLQTYFRGERLIFLWGRVCLLFYCGFSDAESLNCGN